MPPALEQDRRHRDRFLDGALREGIERSCAYRSPCAMFSAVSPTIARSMATVGFLVEIASTRFRAPPTTGSGKANHESPCARTFTRSP